MTKPLEQQLLGYVLDALSDEERAEVDRAITHNPSLLDEVDRLQAMLAPLAADSEPHSPPAGLAEATCAMIAGLDRSQASHSSAVAAYGEDGESQTDSHEVIRVPVAKALAAATNGHSNGHNGNGKGGNGKGHTETTKFGLSPATRREVNEAGSGRRIRLREFVTVFALATVAFAMVFPAMSYSRYNSRVAGCQNNLRELGLALTMYSDSHDGYFPTIPIGQSTIEDRKAGVAGIFSTKLWEDGLLTDSRLLTCPAVQHEGDGVIIPSMEDLIASKTFLGEFQQKMGGDYGYHLGQVIDGKYVPLRNHSAQREYFAIMGDAPSLDGAISSNHGIFGQNLLFESGRVAFVSKPKEDGSWVGNFFVNDAGNVAAGLSFDDSVIAPSFARPNVYALK